MKYNHLTHFITTIIAGVLFAGLVYIFRDYISDYYRGFTTGVFYTLFYCVGFNFIKS